MKIPFLNLETERPARECSKVEREFFSHIYRDYFLFAPSYLLLQMGFNECQMEGLVPRYWPVGVSF